MPGPNVTHHVAEVKIRRIGVHSTGSKGTISSTVALTKTSPTLLMGPTGKMTVSDLMMTVTSRSVCAALLSEKVPSGQKLEKHPDKTYIGRVEKGFDFLGYHISPE